MVHPPIIVKITMKALIKTALLVLIIGNIGAVDIQSYQFIDFLRAIPGPGGPELFENAVVFTAPSHYSRVGISFAYEGYARVHWFRQLLIPRSTAEILEVGGDPRHVEPTRDSGILFHVELIPENLRYMDYRLVIEGLWTSDPQNPLSVRSPAGIVSSRVVLPEPRGIEAQLATPPGHYRFNFRSDPGQHITVGGTFNSWDPFMYVLREVSPGFYTLLLPLSPGYFQYAFFLRGEMLSDPANPRLRYSPNGRAVSEAEVAAIPR